VEKKKLALLTAVAGFCVALTSGRPALSDSTPAVGKESTTIVVAQAEGKKKFRGRLPNNYGNVGISDTQRKTIYGIQAGYRKQLVALTQQIAELKSKQSEELEAVLTAAQLENLKELREASRKKSEDRKKKEKEKAAKSDKATDSADSVK
jgi:hypothetical protein